MDIGRVLGHSLEITWRHKVLWIFGFIMALTGGGASNWFNYNFNRSDFNNNQVLPVRPFPSPPILPAFVITVIAFAACLAVLFLVLVLYFRFVARGALVTFVRNIEKGNTPTLSNAWREGQTYYLRMLGLGFLFYIPLFILTICSLLIAILPIIVTAVAVFGRAGRGQLPSSDIAPFVTAFLGALGLICCTFSCLLVVHLILHPIYEFAVRGIVLEESRTLEGLARGYRRLRENLGSVALLYLLLIGARIGWSIVLGIVAIPLALVLFAIVTLGATTQSVGAFALVGMFVLVALAIAVPFALVLVFLEGLFQVFESNVWTAGYLALLSPPSSLPPIVQEQALAAIG